MPDYKSCYFAYIDLLGFKEIVKAKTCSEIVEIFNEAKKRYIINQITDENEEIPVIPSEEIHYYIMSDSICIYIDDNVPYAFPILAWLCTFFQVRMLCLDTPVFVRGSITKGKIYSDSNVLFGPALVEAYLRAEKLARVPRIIIPVQLYDETKDQTERAMRKGFTYLEQDGFYVTNYINYFCVHSSTVAYREKVYQFVCNALNTSLDQSIREKYLYVKTLMDYYTQEEENSNEQ